MKSVIENQFNGYLEEGLPVIDEKNVQIDFPDTEQMPKNVMFFIQPIEFPPPFCQGVWWRSHTVKV